jgi:hypothetical protein
MTPYAAYCFVPTGYVFHEHVYNYVVRDAATVRSVATATRPYKPARPTVVGAGAGGSGGHHFRVASPSLAEAGVPSAPKMRASADMRSQAFATRSSTAAVRQAVASGHAFQAGSFPISSLPSHRSTLSAGMSNHAPMSRDVQSSGSALRSPHDAPVYSSSPASRSAPVYSGSPASRSAPVYSYHPAPVSRSAPVYSYSPPPSSRPSFSPPPSSRSSGFSAPSHSSPSFSAPSHSSPSFSAPSHSSPSFSAPSHSSSAPSFHSSGGGGHSSGGHGGHR